jgi:hypothetical protein
MDTRPTFLKGESWPRSSWIYALKAARFAGDWDKFMITFKRMTRIPAIANLGQGAALPAGSIPIDDQIASLLLSAATESRKVSAMRDAMRIVAYYKSEKERASEPKSHSEDERSTYSQYWKRQLHRSAKACLESVDNAGQDASYGRNASEERAWHELVDGLQISERRRPENDRTRSRDVRTEKTPREGQLESREPSSDYARRSSRQYESRDVRTERTPFEGRFGSREPRSDYARRSSRQYESR